MSADVFTFISSHGVSLRDSGSAEKGLTRGEIVDLLNLLRGQNIKPLGLEVWHLQGNGRYRIDSLAGWIPESSVDISILFAEAVNVMSSASRKSTPVFTLQF